MPDLAKSLISQNTTQRASLTARDHAIGLSWFIWVYLSINLMFFLRVKLDRNVDRCVYEYCLFSAAIAKFYPSAEPEWLNGNSVGLNPEPPPMLVGTSASTWMESAWLPCWLLYSQQVLHQRWIWGSHRQESIKGIQPGIKTQGRYHQKSKTGFSSPTKRIYMYVLQKM